MLNSKGRGHGYGRVAIEGRVQLISGCGAEERARDGDTLNRVLRRVQLIRVQLIAEEQARDADGGRAGGLRHGMRDGPSAR